MSVFVGLDCGGSSTRVLAIDESGKAVFRGQAGPSNLLSTPEAELRSNLRSASHKCPKADSVYACFAGLIDEETKARALAILKRLFPGAKRIDAAADYVAALAACGKEADACVIAGTGSIVCSWHEGNVVKSGGRGPILGDVGSASHIGRLLLRAYLDEPSKVSPGLKRAVTETFGSSEEKEIIRNLYSTTSPAATLGKLGKAAAREAEAGSERAKLIIQSEMAGLCHLVARHLQRFDSEKDKVTIGLAGGLWKSGSTYKVEFEKCLADEMQGVTINLFILKRAPVLGAAMLARSAALGN